MLFTIPYLTGRRIKRIRLWQLTCPSLVSLSLSLSKVKNLYFWCAFTCRSSTADAFVSFAMMKFFLGCGCTSTDQSASKGKNRKREEGGREREGGGKRKGQAKVRSGGRSRSRLQRVCALCVRVRLIMTRIVWIVAPSRGPPTKDLLSSRRLIRNVQVQNSNRCRNRPLLSDQWMSHE